MRRAGLGMTAAACRPTPRDRQIPGQGRRPWYRLDAATSRYAVSADELELMRQSVSLFSLNQITARTRGIVDGRSVRKPCLIHEALSPPSSDDPVSPIMSGLEDRAVIES